MFKKKHNNFFLLHHIRNEFSATNQLLYHASIQQEIYNKPTLSHPSLKNFLWRHSREMDEGIICKIMDTPFQLDVHD